MSVTRRVKAGRVEPSPDARAIIVHYTVVTTQLDEDGEPSHVDKQPDKQEVALGRSLKGLVPSEISELAQELVQRCKYLPASKTEEVERVLTNLCESLSCTPPRTASSVGAEERRRGRERREDRAERTSGGKAEGARRRTSRSQGRHRRPEDGRLSKEPHRDNHRDSTPSFTTRLARLLPEARVARVDDYVEELYEDEMEMKAAGALRLLRLCTEVEHLQEISEHPTLVGVLSREMRENAKRSHELAVSIAGVFLCLAHFTAFHECLNTHSCVDTTMKLMEFESRRRSVLQAELDLTTEKLASSSSQGGEDRKKLEREERHYRGALGRQDRLLLLCLLALRSLADDSAVERQIVALGICGFLVQAMSRPCEDLLVTTLGLLHKLAVFEENKDALVQSKNAVTRLAGLVLHQRQRISKMAMKVCYNLAFDAAARVALVAQTSLLTGLAPLAQNGPNQKLALQLLYQLSGDASLRSGMASRHPDCVLAPFRLLESQRVGVDAIALCINFAADEKCSKVIVASGLFPPMALHAIRNRDALLLKAVKYVVGHVGIQSRVLAAMREDSGGGADWLPELVRLAVSSSGEPAVLVEALGILSSFSCQSPHVAWATLCDLGLLDVLRRVLVVGSAEGDILLETIMVTGVIALDPEAASLLADSQVPALLPAFLSASLEDSDLIMQLLHTIRCLLWGAAREVVLNETDAPARVMDIVRNARQLEPSRAQAALQAAAEAVLEFILELVGQESTLASRIKAFRFELHNEEWYREVVWCGSATDQDDAYF